MPGMISLGSALAGILATWGVLYVALAGIGLAAQLWGTRSRPRAVGDAPWIGYAFVLLALQLWHLALPITPLTTVLLVGGGWAAAIAYRDAWHGSTWTRTTRVLAAGIVAWIALRAMGAVTLFDSGMYHIPFVNWAKSYAIVPGLANLHGRLGFNPASLLFAAMLDVGPWVDASQHVANGFLVAMYVVPALGRIATLRQDVPARPRALFELAMLPAILVTAMRQDVRSLSTDLPAFVLLAVAGGMLFELLVDRGDQSTGDNGLLVPLLATLGAAVCVKLSAAPFALAGTVVALAAERHTLGATALRRALTLPAALLVVWLARGAILTGYPLYPSRVISLPVDWRVNTEQADAEAAWIVMSARNLNTNSIETSATWMREWLIQVVTRGDLFAHLAAPLIVCVVCGAILLARRRAGRLPWRRGGWVLVPVALSLIMWWLTAPHTRMAQAPFWVLAATAVACALGGRPSLTPRGRTMLFAGSASLFAFMAGRIALGAWYAAEPGQGGRALINALAVERTPEGWLQRMPAPDLLAYQTPSGLHLAVPRVDNSCWNGPLLCTPHPTPRLVMRHPGDPSRGFRGAAAWEPLWFPNPWISFLPYWRCVQRGLASGVKDRAAVEAACRQQAESRAPATAAPQ
ncbi:MAG: hypothetical protein ABI877_14370 [Gemmatimonadaceae bacterium]